MVTNNDGEYSAPGIVIGTYSVTVSLNGFKTHVTDDVRVVTGVVTTLPRVVLEVGAITDTVNVSANTELVHTQQTTISNTVTGEQIQALPVVSRNAMNFVTFLPNVRRRATGRASTVSGSAAEHDQHLARRRQRRRTTAARRRTGCSRWSRRVSTRSKK